MKASRGLYVDAAGEWTAEDARGYSKMLALPGVFWSRANP
jgi:argininosuccinate synthase